MSPKIWAVLALAVAAGALGFIAFGNLGENLVYYWSPTEMQAAGAKAQGATIRLGGLVAPSSLHQSDAGITFDVTDGTCTIPVHTTAIPPQMFREGIGVVVEGTVASDGVFTSNRLMVKHDNQYKAPTAGAEPDKAAMFGTLDDGTKKENGTP
jgi:cytochrome c-type biogenesis protein CcmE